MRGDSGTPEPKLERTGAVVRCEQCLAHRARGALPHQQAAPKVQQVHQRLRRVDLARHPNRFREPPLPEEKLGLEDPLLAQRLPQLPLEVAAGRGRAQDLELSQRAGRVAVQEGESGLQRADQQGVSAAAGRVPLGGERGDDRLEPVGPRLVRLPDSQQPEPGRIHPGVVLPHGPGSGVRLRLDPQPCRSIEEQEERARKPRGAFRRHQPDDLRGPLSGDQQTLQADQRRPTLSWLRRVGFEQGLERRAGAAWVRAADREQLPDSDHLLRPPTGRLAPVDGRWAVSHALTHQGQLVAERGIGVGPAHLGDQAVGLPDVAPPKRHLREMQERGREAGVGAARPLERVRGQRIQGGGRRQEVVVDLAERHPGLAPGGVQRDDLPEPADGRVCRAGEVVSQATGEQGVAVRQQRLARQGHVDELLVLTRELRPVGGLGAFERRERECRIGTHGQPVIIERPAEPHASVLLLPLQEVRDGRRVPFTERRDVHAAPGCQQRGEQVADGPETQLRQRSPGQRRGRAARLAERIALYVVEPEHDGDRLPPIDDRAVDVVAGAPIPADLCRGRRGEASDIGALRRVEEIPPVEPAQRAGALQGVADVGGDVLPGPPLGAGRLGFTQWKDHYPVGVEPRLQGPCPPPDAHAGKGGESEHGQRATPSGPCDGSRSPCDRRRGGVERRAEFVGGWEPVGRDLGQRDFDRRLDGVRYVWADDLQRGRRVGPMAGEHRLGRAAVKRRLPGQHLVQHAPERVEIAPPVDAGVAARLLRTHVLRRPDREPALGEPLASRNGDRAGDAEVGHDGVIVREQDVLGLDVPVHDALAVGVARARRRPRARSEGRRPAGAAAPAAAGPGASHPRRRA